MRRDPRPVWQQVLSGLKIAAGIIIIGAAVLALPSYIPRARIANFVWHLRHGNTMDLLGYRIPVPRDWYVINQSHDDLGLVNVNSGDTVMVLPNKFPTHLPLSAWADSMSHPIIKHKDDFKTTGQRTFKVNDETLLCFEQVATRESIHLYMISCQSESGLTARFFSVNAGKERDEAFYELLQQIRKL